MSELMYVALVTFLGGVIFSQYLEMRDKYKLKNMEDKKPYGEERDPDFIMKSLRKEMADLEELITRLNRIVYLLEEAIEKEEEEEEI